MSVQVSFKWERSTESIGRGIVTNQQLLTFAANEFRRLMNPYVPMGDTGALSSTARVYVDGENGIVEYTQPYSRYQYEGKVMIDPAINAAGLMTNDGWRSRKGATKKVTDRDLIYSKEKHPLATSHWDQAALAVRGNDLIKAMQDYLDRG